MSLSSSDSETKFEVKESGLINAVLCGIFFIMFIAAVFTLNGADNASGWGYRKVGFLTLLPALYFLGRAIHQQKIMVLNKDGIFYKGNFICSHENFVRAYVDEEEVVGSISDNTVLVVEYYYPEKGMNYVIKLKMFTTQDKSVEQILTALQNFKSNVDNYS